MVGWGRWFLLLLFLWGLAACADAGDTAVPLPTVPAHPPAELTGDADRGEVLYQRRVLGSQGAPGCVTCHSLAPNVVLVGPSHYGLADRAAAAVPDQPAAIYLWVAIVDPNAHLTDGYEANAMYGQYAAELSAQDVADLVAYMLTLHE
ncbi:MAG: c-type cytochrome [Anaerolinea sp.]|nr:c-type cytochrome [Anaerolinea sp.]